MLNGENSKNELDEYWSKRYKEGSTGWDIGCVSRPIKEYVDQLEDEGLKILIPGAGNAYEAEYLFRSDFKNTHIIDISEVPLKSFKKRVLDFHADQMIHGDFFELEDTFDLIIEQTFFCSFPPVDNFREKYVKKMHELLVPGGKLVGLWFDFPLTGDLTKRPFGGTRAEYLNLFSSHFKIHTFERAYNSIKPREGNELFAIMERKEDLESNI